MPSLKISNIKYQISNIQLGICNCAGSSFAHLKFAICNSFCSKAGFTRTSRSDGAFTLIELLVTIAIIAILATVGSVVYSGVQKTSRISKRVQDLKAIRTAIELYKTAVGYYPVYSTGTGACIDTSLTVLVPNYMPSLPADPSGGSNCYWYLSDNTASPTEYKIRTSTAEMSNNDYNTQAGTIDPKRDGGTEDCTLEPTATGTAATSAISWAYFTTGACAY